MIRTIFRVGPSVALAVLVGCAASTETRESKSNLELVEGGTLNETISDEIPIELPVAADAKGEAECTWSCTEPENGFFGQYNDLDVRITGKPTKLNGNIVAQIEYVKDTVNSKEWRVSFCCDAPDIECTYHRRTGKTTKQCPNNLNGDPKAACQMDGGSVTKKFEGVGVALIPEKTGDTWCGATTKALDPQPKLTGCMTKYYISDKKPEPPPTFYEGACGSTLEDKDYGYKVKTLAALHCVASRPDIPAKKVEMACTMPVNLLTPIELADSGTLPL